MVTRPSVHHTRSRPSTIARLADPHGVLAPPDHAIRELIASVDEVAVAMEGKWGRGMLPRVVPAEWRQRFLAQAEKFDLAVASGLEAELRVHGAAMIRAWNKLDAVAAEIGIVPTPELVSQLDVIRIEGEAWTLHQLTQLVRANPEAAAVLRGFPMATVHSPSNKPPPDWVRGDDVPF
jgi:hypothetical protein